MSTPTREQDHCQEHSVYLADCDICFSRWLLNAEARANTENATLDDIDEVLATLAAPSFEYQWAVAPDSMTRTTERECAEYWWTRGRQAGLDESRITHNSDLKQMQYMMKGRLEK